MLKISNLLYCIINYMNNNKYDLLIKLLININKKKDELYYSLVLNEFNGDEGIRLITNLINFIESNEPTYANYDKVHEILDELDIIYNSLSFEYQHKNDDIFDDKFYY